MEQIGKNIIKAILKFQAKNRASQTDADNPYFHSRYVTLNKIWDDIRQDLQDLGLAIVQNPISENGGVGVETVIYHHESGEQIISKLTLPLVKHDAQGGGSCITYARRYAICSMLGLTVDIDDDGNLSGLDKKQILTPPKQKSIQEPKVSDLKNSSVPTDAQIKDELIGDIKKMSITVYQTEQNAKIVLKKRCKGKTLVDMTITELKVLANGLDQEYQEYLASSKDTQADKIGEEMF